MSAPRPADGYNKNMVVLSALALALALTQEGTPVPKQDYEALISGLTQEASRIDLTEIGFGDPEHRFGPVMKLVDAGFVAVPALLDHLHDGRLTKAMYSPPRGKGTNPAGGMETPYSVGDYCAAILLSYQEGFGAESIVPASLSKKDPAPELDEWWTKAKPKGEQDYCYQTVIGARSEPPPVPVRLIAIHFPFILPAADEALAVRNPDANTVQLMTLIAQMKFSDQTKLRTCLRNLLGTDPASVDAALKELATVDTKIFDAKMSDLLDKSSTPLAYVSGPEFAGDLAYLVTATSSPRVWDAFVKAEKRADLPDRTSMVEGIDYHNPPSDRRKLVLGFLVSLFADSSKPATMPEQNPRIVSRQPVPPSAQINNIAAKEAGEMLHLIPPDDDAPEAKWAQFRKKVLAVASR